MNSFPPVAELVPPLSSSNSAAADIALDDKGSRGESAKERGYSNNRKNHLHVVPSNFTFDYSSDLKVVRSTMYEPVMDRCAATIIRPSPMRDEGRPEKPPRRHSRVPRNHAASLEAREGLLQDRMKTLNGDASCIDVDHVTIEGAYDKPTKRCDASVQTTHLIPYRLRFLPTISCDPKAVESRSCGCRCRGCCRALGQMVLSQVGLSVVVFVWALVGALAFFNTEGPRELQQSQMLAKIQKELSIELSTELRQTEDSQDTWPATIHKYLERHEKLFLDAVGAGFGEGGGGTIWTYPGCLLFAVSLLTTLGFGAPVPRTPLGRGAAVLFAAVGIPLHFLLIFNMGNLGAIKLQRLAYGTCLTEVPSVPKPRWLKLFPFLAIAFYYTLGVLLFGFLRRREPINCFMFPLDFTAAGGVANVDGQTRIFYALYLETAVTLAAVVVSLLQASASRGIVDVGLKLGLLTNT